MKHAVVLAYPLSLLIGVIHGGMWVFLTGLISGVGLLLIDRILPPLAGAQHASSNQAAVAERILALYPAIHTVVFVFTLWAIAQRDFAAWELAGLIYGLALLTGAGAFPAAHELIHRRAPTQRACGVFLLLFPLYMHFRIEHVHGHHRNVATPLDPASARLGESVYAFFLRSLSLGFINAWRIERARLQRRGLRGWSWRNRMLQYTLIQGAALSGVAYALGQRALLVWLAAALLSVFLLETINYLEHYGLQRRWDAQLKRYEAVGPAHSWNAPQAATNAALFNLGLHANHHRDVGLSFTQLASRAAGPQLPFGYFEMAAIALVPPLWRRLVDPRVPPINAGPQVGAHR